MSVNPKIILFVDDSKIIQATGKKILNGKGFKVLQAFDGFEALKVFMNQLVDLVILDCHMPKVDGLQFMNALRNNANLDKKRSQIPIMVFTTENSPELRRKFEESGVNEFLDKSRVLATPELFLERIFLLLKAQEQVEKYKKIKLKRTLSPLVVDFQAFVKELVQVYLDTEEVPQEYLQLLYNEIDEIIERTSKDNFIELIYDTPHFNDYFVSHAVNSSLLAIFFCFHHLKWDEEKIRNVAVGAIFNDFGNLDKKHRIFNNPTEFNDEQFAFYSKHTERGVELGKKLQLYEASIDYIENHHEREDGTGFPAQKRGNDLSEVAKVAAIIECFDSLTFARGINKQLMEQEAIRKMVSWKDQFSKIHLANFIKFIRQYEFKPPS